MKQAIAKEIIEQMIRDAQKSVKEFEENLAVTFETKHGHDGRELSGARYVNNVQSARDNLHARKLVLQEL